MSSSVPISQTIPHSRKQAKRSHKSKRSRRQPPFGFRDLPPEIRNKIYRLCLVDDVEIGIEEEDTAVYDSDGLAIQGEDRSEYEEIGLVKNRSWDRYKGIYLNLNLLFVDHTTHQEAATILYGLNIFQFFEREWRAFDTFTLCLSRNSFECLRRLDLMFPLVDRYVEGRSVKSRKPLPEVKRRMKTLRRLPKLETLRFRVEDDMMSSDCDCIRWIAGMLVKREIILDTGNASVWNDNYEFKDRLVRISAAALELFCECRWELLGVYEKIDGPHLFSNEVIWLERLREGI